MLGRNFSSNKKHWRFRWDTKNSTFLPAPASGVCTRKEPVKLRALSTVQNKTTNEPNALGYCTNETEWMLIQTSPAPAASPVPSLFYSFGRAFRAEVPLKSGWKKLLCARGPHESPAKYKKRRKPFRSLLSCKYITVRPFQTDEFQNCRVPNAYYAAVLTNSKSQFYF